MSSPLLLLYRTYQALNAWDAEAVLATMARDVEWPDLWSDAGRLVGHDALRASWSHHWARIAPYFLIQGYLRLPDDRLRLDVRHSVRDRTGYLLSNAAQGHIYTFRDDLIAKMEAV